MRENTIRTSQQSSRLRPGTLTPRALRCRGARPRRGCVITRASHKQRCRCCVGGDWRPVQLLTPSVLLRDRSMNASLAPGAWPVPLGRAELPLTPTPSLQGGRRGWGKQPWDDCDAASVQHPALKSVAKATVPDIAHDNYPRYAPLPVWLVYSCKGKSLSSRVISHPPYPGSAAGVDDGQVRHSAKTKFRPRPLRLLSLAWQNIQGRVRGHVRQGMCTPRPLPTLTGCPPVCRSRACRGRSRRCCPE